MKRRDFIQFACVAGIALPLTALAQKVDKLRRLGLLMPFPQRDSAAQRFFDAFAKGLQQLGWFEGKSIAYDMRYSEGTPERLPALAADLVQSKVDVLVVHGAQSVEAARSATHTIPIVVTNVGDMLGGGYSVSLARP